MLSTIALRLRLAHAMRLCDFRDEFGCVYFGLPQERRRTARLLIFTGGDY
jgi:hypothetical protein